MIKKHFKNTFWQQDSLHSIQDSLDMIVVDDGKLSNVAVCRELHLKIPNVMKKPNPVEYIFKDIAKFNKMQ